MTILEDWYASERASLLQPRPTALMLGGMVYSDWYLDVLEQCCLPSLLAPENLEALRACRAQFMLYTDGKSVARLDGIMAAATRVGLEVSILVMPNDIMAEPRPFLRLAAAQSLLVQRALRTGKSFHPINPDHVYSERYFPGLSRLGKKWRNIVHGGINASWPGMKNYLELYRSERRDGAIAIPAKNLATQGWKNTEMCSMNSATEDRLPDEHYQVWRARDRIMLFNPHANPAYITPEAGRIMDEAELTTGTLDCQTQRMFRTNLYIPQPEDDMCFVALSRHQPIPASNYTTLDKFLDRAWAEINNIGPHLAYYVRGTEMLAEIDGSAPEAEEIRLRQQGLVSMMIEKRKKVA